MFCCCHVYTVHRAIVIVIYTIIILLLLLIWIWICCWVLVSVCCVTPFRDIVVVKIIDRDHGAGVVCSQNGQFVDNRVCRCDGLLLILGWHPLSDAALTTTAIRSTEKRRRCQIAASVVRLLVLCQIVRS